MDLDTDQERVASDMHLSDNHKITAQRISSQSMAFSGAAHFENSSHNSKYYFICLRGWLRFIEGSIFQ